MGRVRNRDFDKRTRPLQCRVDSETQAEVLAYARRESLSIAEALRTRIEWGLIEVRNSPQIRCRKAEIRPDPGGLPRTAGQSIHRWGR